MSLLLAMTAIGGIAPSTARAEEDETTDARLEGYDRKVAEKSGVCGTWLIFIMLSVIGCSVVFKDAKRVQRE